MKSLIIFGIGDMARLAHYYFSKDSDYHVKAFCVSDEIYDSRCFLDLPVIPLSQLSDKYPATSNAIFVALGYSNVNKNRKNIYKHVKKIGYDCITYISPDATVLTDDIGDNVFIFEDNTIQPFTKIGSNTILWSGNHIGHDSIIGEHCFIASHVVVSGHVKIGNSCFLGVNATLRNDITIGDECVIGAGAWINKSIEDRSVYVASPTEKYKRGSDQLRSL